MILNKLLLFKLTLCALIWGCQQPNSTKQSSSSKIANEQRPEASTEGACQACLKAVPKWNSLRTRMSDVIQEFEQSGNHFSFSPNAEDSVIHVYFGIEDSSETLQCYVVSFNEQSNLHCNLVTISESKDTIHFEKVLSNSKQSISIQEGIERIENWINQEVRNQWITSTFNNYGDSAMALAFVIPTNDLSVGDEHLFYFALEENPTSLSGYEADMIIVNYDSGIFINLEDMVHSVPPFGRYPSTQYDHFEILKELDIK